MHLVNLAVTYEARAFQPKAARRDGRDCGREPMLRDTVYLSSVCVCSVRSSASPVEVGAASHRVVAEIFLGFLVAKVLQRVGPQQVTHGPESRRLLKSIQLQRKDAQKNEAKGRKTSSQSEADV